MDFIMNYFLELNFPQHTKQPSNSSKTKGPLKFSIKHITIRLISP